MAAFQAHGAPYNYALDFIDFDNVVMNGMLKSDLIPPHPNPLPHRGEGIKRELRYYSLSPRSGGEGWGEGGRQETSPHLKDWVLRELKWQETPTPQP